LFQGIKGKLTFYAECEVKKWEEIAGYPKKERQRLNSLFGITVVLMTRIASVNI
jgi:hypothetical protein